jgi:hypothetical protein
VVVKVKRELHLPMLVTHFDRSDVFSKGHKLVIDAALLEKVGSGAVEVCCGS